jgi:tetratricopeptide (TPR) repeat protein
VLSIWLPLHRASEYCIERAFAHCFCGVFCTGRKHWECARTLTLIWLLCRTVLPKKDAETFRSVVSCYETKQYRKGLKNAEALLKKYPNHGETMSMKALILNCTGKKEEAYALAKLGLRNDLSSSTCWHISGLIHKSDGNYKEASKCYLQAVKIDPSNQNIMRDLSWLQIQVGSQCSALLVFSIVTFYDFAQMRDLNGYINSRRKILDSKPSLRPSWVAYATATYLAGEYAMAYTVIEKYFENLGGTNLESAEKYEESEFTMFQNRCLEKQGKYTEAIEHLEKNAANIVDKLSASIKHAEMLVRSGNFAAAKEKWMALTVSQTENYRFHCGLQAAYLEIAGSDCDTIFGLKRLELPCTHWKLTEEQNALLNSMYSSQAQFASSRAVSKIRLSLVNNAEELRPLLDVHCRKCLVDGVPSLYHDVAFLVRQPDFVTPEVVKIVSEPVDFRAHPNAIMALDLIGGYITQLRASGHFSEQDRADGKPKENPAALLWALFLLANLLERCGHLEDAHRTITECMEHTPTALDMHVRLGKILRKSGDLVQASTVMDGVRALDLQDRYLNNKATKYLLRADNVTQAMDTIAMFTKHDGSDPQQTLTDLQCNWYELELAESYARASKWGLALKKFYSIQKHFLDYVEDMFDFHSYAQSRKVCALTVLYCWFVETVDDFVNAMCRPLCVCTQTH